MDGCGASTCAADISTCSECLGQLQHRQNAWSPDDSTCYESCMDAPADAACFPGTDYGVEVCPCNERSCEDCMEGDSCAWSPDAQDPKCLNDCSEGPADASCFPGSNYGPEICPSDNREAAPPPPPPPTDDGTEPATTNSTVSATGSCPEGTDARCYCSGPGDDPMCDVTQRITLVSEQNASACEDACVITCGEVAGFDFSCYPEELELNPCNTVSTCTCACGAPPITGVQFGGQCSAYCSREDVCGNTTADGSEFVCPAPTTSSARSVVLGTLAGAFSLVASLAATMF